MPKIVTIKDIAREAGVSPSLVSFVFNGKNRVGEETRRRILEVAERLGYRTGQAARVPWPRKAWRDLWPLPCLERKKTASPPCKSPRNLLSRWETGRTKPYKN